jgi:hypothetical protein
MKKKLVIRANKHAKKNRERSISASLISLYEKKSHPSHHRVTKEEGNNDFLQT